MATGGGAALVIGVGVYGYQNTTFDLPDYEHSYDITGTDLLASFPINGSSTIASDVPVIHPAPEGFTLVAPPTVDQLIVTTDSTTAKYGVSVEDGRATICCTVTKNTHR